MGKATNRVYSVVVFPDNPEKGQMNVGDLIGWPRELNGTWPTSRITGSYIHINLHWWQGHATETCPGSFYKHVSNGLCHILGLMKNKTKNQNLRKTSKYSFKEQETSNINDKSGHCKMELHWASELSI